MPGNMVEFSSNGGICKGYLANPTGAKAPSVVVIQEWWGLVDHIKDIVDRFAREGFVAVAPDLYHGQTTKSPDEAGKLLMALNIVQAEKDLRGTIQYLLSLEQTAGDRVGVVGFCMGGQLALYAACSNATVGACVDYYGIHPNVHPLISQLRAPVLGFFGEKDSSVKPEAVRKLEERLNSAGKQVEFHIYAGANHAFFNDTRPEVYNETLARRSWERTLQFLREHLNVA
jgi:carboxymethylenebutenolidase